MTFGDALETYRERLKGDYSLKDRSKTFREERITALLKSWSDLEQTDVAQISKSDCLAWAARFGQNEERAKLVLSWPSLCENGQEISGSAMSWLK